MYCHFWASSLRKKTKTRGIIPSNSIRIIKRKFYITEMSFSDWFVVLIRHNTRHSKNRISFAILDEFTPQKEHYWWHSIIEFFLYYWNERRIEKKKRSIGTVSSPSFVNDQKLYIAYNRKSGWIENKNKFMWNVSSRIIILFEDRSFQSIYLLSSWCCGRRSSSIVLGIRNALWFMCNKYTIGVYFRGIFESNIPRNSMTWIQK